MLTVNGDKYNQLTAVTEILYIFEYQIKKAF